MKCEQGSSKHFEVTVFSPEGFWGFGLSEAVTLVLGRTTLSRAARFLRQLSVEPLQSLKSPLCVFYPSSLSDSETPRVRLACTPWGGRAEWNLELEAAENTENAGRLLTEAGRPESFSTRVPF